MAKYKKIIIYIFFIILFIIGYAYYNLFHNLQSVPKGELIRSIESPDGNYVIKTYFNDGGSLSHDAARGELYNIKRERGKTIYWNYPDHDPYVKWLNNKEVLLGDQVLNILKGETYDWRHDPDWKREYPKQFKIPPTSHS